MSPFGNGRRRWKQLWKKRLAGILAISLLGGLLPLGGTEFGAAAGSAQAAAVFVTELHPDNASTDNFEFIELHNAGEEPATVTDSVYYRYTDNSKPDVPILLPPGTVLAPGETKIIWYNNAGKTLADFKAFYGVNLDAGQVVQMLAGSFAGMANSGNRAIVLKENGNDYAAASYLSGDIAAGFGVQYKRSAGVEEDKLAVKSVPTPGTVTPDQLAAPTPVPTADKPVITHTPAASAPADRYLPIVAQVAADGGVAISGVSAAVYYRSVGDAVYQSAPLTAAEDGIRFAGAIPASAMKAPQLLYYLQADNDGQRTVSDTYPVQVEAGGVDPDRLPPLLITELVPDTDNIGGSDGYEFVEIYNNTDRSLNFDDYKLYYRYPDKGPSADLTWPTDPEAITIPAQCSIVLWIINAANGTAAAADFNANYGSALTEGVNLFRVYSSGMANGSPRQLVVGTNTHVDITVASYVGGSADVKANMGIQYQYPTDGSNAMIKVKPGTEPATPGRVDAWQAPAQPVHVPDDTLPPVLADRTATGIVGPNQDLEVRLDASDDRDVISVKFRYQTSRQSGPTEVYLTQDYNDTYYHGLIPAADLIGADYVEYSAIASDGQNQTSFGPARVAVTNDRDRSALRLNVKEGQYVKGSVILKGTAEANDPDQLRLSVDGAETTSGISRSLEKDAYLAFDVSGVDYYFKNAVTIGDEILYTFMDPIPSWKTMVYPIASDRLKEGTNGIWIRSGSKSGPFDERPEENKDDFQIKNVRLILADGTEIRDPAYADGSKVLDMGDSAGKHVGIEFGFPLQHEQLRSLTYAWNTSALADGAHTVVLNGPSGSVSADVNVDNSAPVIQPTIEEGKEYRGTLTLDAAVSDALSGIKPGSESAQLDGAPVTLPYATIISKLGSGTHALTVTAEDNVSNRAELTVHFLVPEENPLAPELISPLLNAAVSGSSAGLAVRVNDPNGDRLKVGFYRGFLHSAAQPASFKAYTGQAAIEPPAVLKPEGERELAPEEYASIEADDGTKLTNDSTELFPYHRFEIKLDPSVQTDDEVQLEWTGSSLAGRKVSLYAWSPSANKWVPLDRKIPADEGSFKLEASVAAGDYALDGVVNALVQDEPDPGSRGYDFSFVWMSDTQYYSDSWPDIYKGNTQWIMDNRDAMNIKYVIHTGDIVDQADKPYQWQNAEEAMKILDNGGMPYGVLAGNHDVGHQNSDYTEFWKNYGEARFQDRPYYGGSYQNNRGHYDLISAGGNDFIIVYMGWNIGDNEIKWVGDVLRQYPERKAILAFHEYLLVSGNRAPIADEIFEKVVKPNKNVFAVLSGHYHDAETLVDPIDDDCDGQPDRQVYQILADYQGAEKGGLGYIRLLQFHIADSRIDVKTYSPYLDHYNYYDPAEYPGKDEFSIQTDLAPVVKRVATDSMKAEVYTHSLIDEAEDVASGSEVQMNWSGLKAGMPSQWYVTVRDDYSGYVRSPIWSFTADGQATEPSESPEPSPSVSPSPGPSESPNPTPSPSASLEPSPSASPSPGPSESPNPTPSPSASPEPSPSASPSPEPSASPSPAPEFRDVPAGHWAADAIRRAASLGIVSGDGNGSFRPEAGVSRAELIAMLGRALGWPASRPATADGFTDAADIPAWARGYAAQARAAGLVSGYADGSFGPGRPLSRAELAVLVSRAAGLLPAPGTAPGFTDSARIPAWATPHVAAVQAAGLMNGTGGGAFAPLRTVTRAEAAAVILRLIDAGLLGE